VRVVQQFIGAFVQHQPARFQRDGFIGHLQRALHVLFHHQHGRALVGQATQQLEDIGHHQRAQADGRLVNQQHLGPQQQRAAHFQLLLFTTRQRRRGAVQPLFEARKTVQHFGHALARGLHAQRDATQFQVLEYAELAKQVAALRHKSNAMRDQQVFGLCARDVLPVQADLALAHFQHAKQRFQHRALARAIGAQQQGDVATFGFHAQVVEDHEVAIAGHHVVKLDAGLLSHLSCPNRRPAPACWRVFLPACRWPSSCLPPSPGCGGTGPSQSPCCVR
jgi:hypothetical protein